MPIYGQLIIYFQDICLKVSTFKSINICKDFYFQTDKHHCLLCSSISCGYIAWLFRSVPLLPQQHVAFPLPAVATEVIVWCKRLSG
jgi:hypothetical protein